MLAFVTLFLLTALQGIMSSLSSRSRNRSNLTYHMCCQVISHGVWLLVISSILKELMANDLTLSVATAYIAGYTLGSLCGAKVSMKIEKIIGAKADA